MNLTADLFDREFAKKGREDFDLDCDCERETTCKPTQANTRRYIGGMIQN